MTTPGPPNQPEPYPSAYPAPYGEQPGPHPVAPQPAPSATLAIIGLVTAIIPCTALVGIVLSIVALVRSRRGGAGRGLAIAGIVVGVLWVLAVVAAFAFGFTTLWQTCAELGDGVHQVDGVTYTCDV
jgi:hypothetical protein